jgi:transcriptional regulator with XRE-family HTH domain
MAWLDQLKESRDIPSDMQLAQRAKISAPSVISGWRTGRTQPSKENLRKIANYAGEAPVTLWRLAGLVDDGDLDAPELAPSEPLPRQIQDLITLYRGADKSARKVILGQVEFLVNAMTER